MAPLLDRVRRTTTFVLALFLWLHALFLLPIQPIFISKLARVLHLAPSEAVIFALLVVLSFLAASGFWRTIGSLAYIYGFPFVVLGYVLWRGFRLMRAINRWLIAQAISPPIAVSIVVPQNAAATAPTPSSGTKTSVNTRITTEIWRFLLRPFQRFMILWCTLLLVTTHTTVLWLCLIVVLAQLARQIFIMAKLLLFSPWVTETLRKIGPALLTPVNNALSALGNLTIDATPTNELRNLLNQLNIWRAVVSFLKDKYLVSRWAWIVGGVVLAGLYAYIACLFSFAYYGIARVSGISYTWPDALVTSIFFPFFFRELPRILGIRILSGVHCVLLLGVGIGTIVNFLNRKLDDIRKAATEVSNRFAEQTILEKYTILREMFPSSETLAPAVSKEMTVSDSRREEY